MITEDLKLAIKTHCLNSERESCGLVVNCDGVYKAFPAQNEVTLGIKRFSIDPKDYLKASLMGKIEYLYHSHVGEMTEFSEFDKVNLENHKLKGIVYNTNKDSFSFYLPNNYKNAYVGKTFEMGKTDCFTIVRDIYHKELGIEIPDFPRDDEWQKKEPDLYIKYLKQEKFTIIYDTNFQIQNLKLYDIILMRLTKSTFPDHAAVYMGDGVILHHLRGGFSTLEAFYDRYVERTAIVVRHERFI